MSDLNQPGENDGVEGDPALLKADRKEQGQVEDEDTDDHVHTEGEDAGLGAGRIPPPPD
jgi:hypothetical protein